MANSRLSDNDALTFHAYVGADPVNATDPTGKAILHWTSPNNVRMTINYTIDQSRAAAGFDPGRASAAIASKFSGQTTFGNTIVSVAAEAVYIAGATSGSVPDLKTITIFPVGQLPAQAATGGRPYVDSVGGSQIHVTPREGSPQIAHELGGHSSGAGDQYVSGVGANSSRVTAAGPGNNIMQDYRGSANAQTLREIINAPTNQNTCAKGASSLTGAC